MGLKKAVMLLLLLSSVIPFIVHPVMALEFTDGFETGDFSLWTSTTGGNGETETVETTQVHHGTYSADFYCNGGGVSEYAYATLEELGPYSDPFYVRVYIFINGTLDTNVAKFLSAPNIRNLTTSGYSFAFLEAYETGGIFVWRLVGKNGAGYSYNVTSIEVFNATWYCVELAVDVQIDSTSWCTLWLDGVKVATLTGLDWTQAGTGVTTVQIGERWTQEPSFEHHIYVDCVVFDTSYIGPESSNNAPTIGSFQGPSTLYANTYDFVNCTIKDADLIADFENVTVQLNGSIQLKWVNSTNTFSEVADPSKYCTLDASGSVKTIENTTALTLSWKVKLYWNYTEGAIFMNGTVYDGDTSGSGGPTSVCTFEDDIEVDSAIHDPPEPEYGIPFTVSGTIHYSGTSTAPEDGTGITVRLEKVGFVVASDTTVTDSTGAFSISHTEPEPGDWSYNVYAITPDEASTLNQTERVIVVKGGGSSYVPPDQTEPTEENQTEPEDWVGPGAIPPSPSFQVNPMVLGGFIVVAVILATAYTQTPKLKKTRKNWKKSQKEQKKKPWKKSDGAFK